MIAARLDGVRVRGEAIAGIEATLIRRVDDCRWARSSRPAKKLNVGERIRFGETRESNACLLGALDAEVEEKDEGGEVLLRFDFAGAALDEAIERLGATPLPPYIAGERRAVRTRTGPTTRRMFAAEPGAVAAPTAGLHFTPELVGRDRSARRRAASGDAPCRRGHVSAGQGRGHPRPSRCTPNGARSTTRRPPR